MFYTVNASKSWVLVAQLCGELCLTLNCTYIKCILWEVFRKMTSFPMKSILNLIHSCTSKSLSKIQEMVF